jgi:hypothetical protein
MNKINHAMRYAGKLVLTLFLLICLFIPTPAFALDYDAEAKNYLTSVQNELGSIKTIVQQLPNISVENGQKTLAEVQAKLDGIQSSSKEKADLFKNFSNNYQVSYEDKLKSISQLYDLQKEYNRLIPTLSKEAQEILDYIKVCVKSEFWCDTFKFAITQPGDLGNQNLNQVRDFLTISNQLSVPLDYVYKSIQKYEQESRDLSKVIVLTDKVSVLADNLEKRINLAKQKTNNIQEYAAVLKSFSDPDILGEIKDLDQYIGELTQNLPL